MVKGQESMETTENYENESKEGKRAFWRFSEAPSTAKSTKVEAVGCRWGGLGEVMRAFGDESRVMLAGVV